ncbi:unnamed protein product [Discosporangium mesarthrocarpum]
MTDKNVDINSDGEQSKELGGFTGDLGGGIFPSDFDAQPPQITIRDAELDVGQPEAIIGIWHLYTEAGSGDVSDRIIFRADGRVVGGPSMRETPEVSWSDPEGLRPQGGAWRVYKDDGGRQSRLRFTLIVSHAKEQWLELDGMVMMVDGYNERSGQVEAQPQIFGDVLKRMKVPGGGETKEEEAGDFSMMKIPTTGDSLIGTVNSKPQRLW